MMGIAIKKESSRGVSEVNASVNILDFFQSQILPELQDPNHGARPVVKATSIKFVASFRNQFTREDLVQIMPLLIQHLASPVVVVHTFAAYAIERILFTKEVATGTGMTMKRPKITAVELKPFLQPLFNGLFAIIDNTRWNENDYVMKCVMRSLSSAGEDVLPVVQIVITKLTEALGRIAANPRNPQFNHYLFESIAVLVSSVCKKDPHQVEAFEGLLFAPFTTILHKEIVEFSPYVFQIMAQLLEFRPSASGLGQAYTSMFPAVLNAKAWEKKGDIPALARLLQAYITTAPSDILNSLDSILGIFQKLVATRSTEASGFDILTSAIVHFPQESMEPKLGTIFRILVVRLQSIPNADRYKKLVTTFFALFVGKFGAHVFIDRLNAMQNGLAVILLQQIWLPRLRSMPPAQRIEVKTHVVGLTKFLCETPVLLDDNHKNLFLDCLVNLVQLCTSPSLTATTTTAAGDAVDDIQLEVEYDSQFSKLHFASRSAEDYFPDVTDPTLFFVQTLNQLFSQQAAGQLLAFIRQHLQQGPNVDPKVWTSLVSIFQRHGVQLA